MFLLIRNQMKRTIEYIKAQDTKTPQEINEEIKNFRDKRLLEEQEKQNNVVLHKILFFCLAHCIFAYRFIYLFILFYRFCKL